MGGKPEKAPILLVDDRQEGLLTLETVLDRPDYEFLKATSGEEALAHLAGRDVAVVLMDVQMPRMSGLETAARIRGLERNRDTPIVFITAVDMEDATIHRGYEAGAVDYILKPFDPIVLRSKVAALVEIFRKKAEIRRQGEMLRQVEAAAKEQELRRLEAEGEQRYRNLADAVPSLVFSARADGSIDYLNRAWTELTGLTPERSAGTGWQEAFHAGDLAALLRSWEDARASGRGFETECRIRSARDQAYRWHLIRVAAEKRGDGTEIIGWTGAGSDIHDRKLAEERRTAESENRFQMLIDAVRDYAIVMLDPGGLIVSWNPGAERINGYQAHEIVGQHFSRFYTEKDLFDRAPVRALEEAAATGRSEAEGWRVRKDGTTFWANVVITPIRGENGELTGYSKVTRDMTEQKRAEAERSRLLVRERVALESSRMKSQFLANMSHEIRTPMNAIMGTLGLLLDTKLRPDQREYLTIARKSADGLLTVINDVLDLSRIESGRLSLDVTDLDFASIIRETAESLASEAARKNLKLSVDVGNVEPSWVKGDSGRIRQVVTNLLSNAIKFTQQGEIRVRMSETPGRREQDVSLRVEVVDTGIGIPRDAHSRLFQAFSQADAETTRQYGGTGLGLSICKRLVDLMGGEIGFESEEGKGSRFWFTVDLERGSPVESRAVAPTRGDGRLKGARVLVAEDNTVNRIVLASMLERLGCRSDSVGSGEEAIQALSQFPYDVVLMDCQMPGMDGYECTDRIRNAAGAAFSGIPIVAVTAHAMRGDEEKCLRAGMNDYLCKPIDMDKLANTLRKWVPGPPGRQIDRKALAIDEDLAGEVAEIFCLEAPVHLQKIREAFSHNDRKTLLSEVHDLKSSCGYVGAAHMKATCEEIESLAKSGETDRAADAISRLERDFPKVRQELRAH